MKRLIMSLILLPLFPALACGGGPPKVTTPAPPPEEQDAGVVAERDSERMRQRQAASNTVLTGSQGDTSQANIGVKSLLGA